MKKNHPWNVLIIPAANEIALEIHRALRDSKEVMLHGAQEADTNNVAAFHFKQLHGIPPIHNSSCTAVLQKLILENNIDAIFPTCDEVALWLAKNAAHLKTEIISCSPAVRAMSRSKSTTYELLEGHVRIPQLWNCTTTDIKFPCFMKSNKRHNNQKTGLIDNSAALAEIMALKPDLLIMEYLPGEEYIIDCFSQRGRGVLYAQARTDTEAKNSSASITRQVSLPKAAELAEKIGDCFQLYGPWFFHVKKDADDQLCVLKVTSGISNGMSLNRVTGPNFPLLALYEAAGHTIKIDSFQADIAMCHSFDVRFNYNQQIDALYIDLDDTLIIRGEVNSQLVALVFQFWNKKIPVHLITRHKADLNATLAKHRLTNLFDRIIHITDDKTPKSQFIKEKKAIFIDDSFRERYVASQILGIQCFDAASAICLFDERS